MKKIFVLLFILIGCNIFAWESVETVDEFDEPTGKVRIFNYDITGKAFMFIDKSEEEYSIAFRGNEFVGGIGPYNESTIKIKIDQEQPVILDGFVWSNNFTVSATLPNSLIAKMKTGKKMKASIEKYNNQTFLLQFNLDGFEENLKKVK